MGGSRQPLVPPVGGVSADRDDRKDDTAITFAELAAGVVGGYEPPPGYAPTTMRRGPLRRLPRAPRRRIATEGRNGLASVASISSASSGPASGPTMKPSRDMQNDARPTLISDLLALYFFWKNTTLYPSGSWTTR
jgi:hypothetical protein